MKIRFLRISNSVKESETFLSCFYHDQGRTKKLKYLHLIVLCSSYRYLFIIIYSEMLSGKNNFLYWLLYNYNGRVRQFNFGGISSNEGREILLWDPSLQIPYILSKNDTSSCGSPFLGKLSLGIQKCIIYSIIPRFYYL